MIYKDGVYIEVRKVVEGIPVIVRFSRPIKKAMNLSDAVSKSVSNKEIVITSGFDGTHGDKSKHYDGNAFDMRIWFYTEDQISQIISELNELLGYDYDIVLESDHIHIEYDPK